MWRCAKAPSSRLRHLRGDLPAGSSSSRLYRRADRGRVGGALGRLAASSAE